MKWIAHNIRHVTEEMYRSWFEAMDTQKKQRVERFRFRDDRLRTITGDWLARKAISEYSGVTPSDILFGKEANGKPFVENLPVYFNISHSHDMVVCAVNDTPVGVDIERIRPIRLAAAKRVCTAWELTYIFGHNPTDHDFAHTDDSAVLTRFFKLWTAKEAYAKRTGGGIHDLKHAVDFEHCRFFVPHPDYIGCLYSDPHN